VSGYRGKRLLDLTLAIPALIVSLPVQAVLAIAVHRKLGSPVIFRQQRPGRDGEPFELRKFRTMLDIDESKGLVSDDDRMTSFGAKLRATSMDELPTLWNVVRGDMSLVGPRPLLMRYLDRYTPDQARRHEVHPGLTGLAQVNGRNGISWDEKFRLDIEYVDSLSLSGDVRIILQTLAKVVRREGISADGISTMTEFTGREF